MDDRGFYEQARLFNHDEIQLWHYVVENRTDDTAFYALMDKAREKPGVEIRSMEHLAELLEEQRKAQEEQSD